MKYNKTPSISILVVTNGPVATAGSISNFLKIRGVKVPGGGSCFYSKLVSAITRRRKHLQTSY